MVEWYKSVRQLIDGLMKNTFSGFDYNVLKVIGGVVGTLLFFVLPIPVILIFGKYGQGMLFGYMVFFRRMSCWKL